MLGIPRPRTLAECGQEARPCPWVGCRHHLYLELAEAKPRTHGPAIPTALRMNGKERSRRLGRRSGLRSSDAVALVRTWIDEIVERLGRAPEYTCTFDFVADYPDGAPPAVIARVLGVAEQLIDRQARDAERVMRAAVERRMREALGVGSGFITP